MCNRHVEKSGRWLGDVRSEMSPSRRVAAHTVIGFERNSTRCAEVAAELETIASTIDSKLAAALAPLPIDAGEIGTMTPEVSGLQKWQALADTMLVFVPKGPSPAHHPSLTLVLPCDLLQDDESRAAMLGQFTQLADDYSSIACVFIESDTGEQRQHGWDQATWKAWLGQVTEVLPGTVVRFYVVGSTTSDGRLLTAADQTAVAAHAVLADVVLRDRNAPRFLVQSTRRPEASLGLLGMSGQVVCAETASKCLAPRLWAELFEELHSCQPVGIDVKEALPTEPFQLLVQAFEHQMPFDATAALERAESRERGDYEAPSVVGYDSRFTANIGKAAKVPALDGIPASLWRARLTELDALISRDKASEIAARACEYLEQLKTRDERRIQGVLRNAFATRLSEGPLRAIGDRLLDAIKHRNTLVVCGAEEDIDESLDRMDAKVHQMVCWRNGLFATLLALLLAIATIWACNTWATGAVRAWGTILPVVAFVAIGLGAAGRWCWVRHLAIQSRDDVLEQIQRRAQHVICLRLLQALNDTASGLFDSTQSRVRVLCDAVRVINNAPSEKANSSLETQQPLIERPGAHSEEMDRVYRFVTRQTSGHRSLSEKLRERCRDLADALIQGNVAPAHALTSLHEFLMNELQLLLSKRMEIWRLYCWDNTASSFDDATFSSRVQQWSVPVFCGTGSVLADRGGDELLTSTSWICPDALASRVTSHADNTLLPMDDRILALHRLTMPSTGT